MKKIFVTSFILTALLLACNTTPKDRTIKFEGIENARELGGLKMQDGRIIKEGKLIRSGNLSMATDADAKVLKDRFRLTDVVDFRFDAEVKGAPDREIEGVQYTHLSTLPKSIIAGFSSGRTDAAEMKSQDIGELLAKYASYPQAQEMAQKLYPTIVTDSLSQKYYGEFLRTVLKAEGGVLWHCSQGKDRVGCGTAFLLTALGASRETIIEDFDLSNVSYAPYVEKLSAQIKENGGGENELAFIQAMIGVSTENFTKALDLIETQYGSLQNYVTKALQFSEEEQELLKEKYLR